MFKKIRRLHGLMKELELPRKGWKLSKRASAAAKEEYPIDFVVTWVDGNDPEWRKEKAKYEKEAGMEGNIAARYRDWELLRYWFRMVERYAPWVHRVYFVTCGHVPSWLNEECPKLEIIKHSDYMAEEYLPTFSSIPIELNLWRIKDLSEHFVYFNDDTFLTRHVTPETFFENGLPRYCAVAKPLDNYGLYSAFQHELFSNLGIINRDFSIRDCMEKHPEKWFSYRYGEDVIYNIQAYRDRCLTGIYFTHLACPYRKTPFEAVWKKHFERLDWTCRHRFRSGMDVMHQLFQLWDICSGDFSPVPRNYYGTAPVRMSREAVESVLKEENIFVCLNDNELLTDQDYIELKNYCIQRLESKFHEKSIFEK